MVNVQLILLFYPTFDTKVLAPNLNVFSNFTSKNLNFARKGLFSQLVSNDK